MSTSPNTRLPWLLVALLVALNIVVLTVVWLRPSLADRPPLHGPGGPGGLPKELGMNAEETERVRIVQQVHFDRMDGYFQQIVALRHEAFALFGKPQADSAAAMAALDRIGAVQAAAEKERYRHFHELLAYCTPAQALRFQNLLPDLLARKRQPEGGLKRPNLAPGPPPH
jgi:Spy/CpxP family protein refolding chaperone